MLIYPEVQRGEVKEGVLDVMGVACDVSNEDSVKSAFEEVISRFGCVDAVVASAGAKFYCNCTNCSQDLR